MQVYCVVGIRGLTPHPHERSLERSFCGAPTFAGLNRQCVCERMPYANRQTVHKLPQRAQVGLSKSTRALFRKKITKFSAQKFLQGKNKDRTVVGHIKGLLGLLEFHPSVVHFEFVRRSGSSYAALFHVVAFSLLNSYSFCPIVRFL